MATLILEDGTTFKGRLFGANASVSGEVGKSYFMRRQIGPLIRNICLTSSV